MGFKNLIKKIIPQFLISFYHFFLVLFGAILYQFPSRKLKVIGVTGTNGKTTVVEMTSKILKEAGHRVASLSSIRFKVGDKEWQNELRMTMPGRFQIQKFLRQAVNGGCHYAVLEVTSEGIKQYRHKSINFNAAVFTNLTPEHIEAHGSFENYKKAKGKLFKTVKNIHIINIDDENAEFFLQFPAKKKYTYGLKQGDINNEDIHLNLKLIGEFNIYNALAAICVGLSQGIDLGTCRRALEKIKGIPGRMELVISEPFKVFVDYAFTPNALRKVHETLQKSKIKEHCLENESFLETGKSKMICVLGACGGGRDKWKRPVLGEIAAKYCDKIIITNEDPYDEDPNQILLMIKSGISKSQFPISNFYEIIDRREAIRKSLELAEQNDIVIITGKGCEPSICIANGKKIPWDDRKAAKEEFEKIDAKKD